MSIILIAITVYDAYTYYTCKYNLYGKQIMHNNSNTKWIVAACACKVW